MGWLLAHSSDAVRAPYALEVAGAVVGAGWSSRWLFGGLVLLVALERGVELLISRRNVRESLARGAVEFGEDHYPWMVGLHSSFLVASVAEVWLLRRPLYPALAAAMLLLLVLSMALRYWVIGTLGRRWSTRVVCLPGEPRVVSGPYRFMAHPNYLAVVVEMVALPLVHTGWLTALSYSLANALVLRVRIAVEEEALRGAGDYAGGSPDVGRESSP